MHSLNEDASKREMDRTAGALSHLRWVLDHVRSTMEMEVAFVARFRGERRDIDYVSISPNAAGLELDAGTSDPLDQSACWRIASGQLPLVMQDARKERGSKDLDAIHALPVGGHVSVPIQDAANEPIGMLCCFSRDCRPDLSNEHARFLGHFASLLAIDLRILDESRNFFEFRKAEIRDVITQGRFFPVFQPIFDLTTAEIRYTEGLTRLAPDVATDIIGILARARVFDIGSELELAFAERIMQTATLSDPRVPVGVNLSERALVSDEFLRFLARHDHRGTVIELTEHEPIFNEARLMERVSQARRHGAKLALDDTGGGFSSLHNILALRPDILKIDKSIAENIESDRLVSHLVRHLQEYCSEVGAELVVEGVETPGQLATLHKLGVKLAQGFLLGRPDAILDRKASEVTGAEVLQRAVS